MNQAVQNTFAADIAHSIVTSARASLVKRTQMALAWIKHVNKVQSERQALLNMSAEQLQDIGITPSAAKAEAARPFWDLP